MENRPTTIKIDDDSLENVNSYTYLGNFVTIEGHHNKRLQEDSKLHGTTLES